MFKKTMLAAVACFATLGAVAAEEATTLTNDAGAAPPAVETSTVDPESQATFRGWVKKTYAQLQEGYEDFMNRTEDSTGEVGPKLEETLETPSE